MSRRSQIRVIVPRPKNPANSRAVHSEDAPAPGTHCTGTPPQGGLQVRAPHSSAVFISHSTSDSSVAERLVKYLEGAGYNCSIAPRDVEPGSSWAAEITGAIERSSAMVLLLSASSASSAEVEREIAAAARRQLRIVTLRLDDTRFTAALEYYLASSQWIGIVGSDKSTASSDVAFEQLVRSLESVHAAADEQVADGTSRRTARLRRLSGAFAIAVLLLGATAIVLGNLWHNQGARIPDRTVDDGRSRRHDRRTNRSDQRATRQPVVRGERAPRLSHLVDRSHERASIEAA